MILYRRVFQSVHQKSEIYIPFSVLDEDFQV